MCHTELKQYVNLSGCDSFNQRKRPFCGLSGEFQCRVRVSVSLSHIHLCSFIYSFAGFSEDRAQQLRERQQREMREAQERLRAEWADDEVKSDIFVVLAVAT